MIGGFGRMSTTGQMGGIAGRFSSPTQYQKNVAKLKKLESQLAGAKKAVKEQKSLMMRAFFSPEGYKAAVAKLKALEAKVTRLDKQVKDLKHLMTVA
jgi:hypothetical protein